MRLDTDVAIALRDALADAFRSYEQLKLVTIRAGERIENISERKGIAVVITDLVEYFERTDRVEQLLAAAKKENPHSGALRAIKPEDLVPTQPNAEGREVAEAATEPASGQVGILNFRAEVLAAVDDLAHDNQGIQLAAVQRFERLLSDADDNQAQTIYQVILGNVKAEFSDPVERELVRALASSIHRIGPPRSATGTSPGLDLARTRLPGILLEDAVLEYADIAFADLRGANLTGANLHRVRGYGANLAKARLSRSNIQEGRLRALRAPEAKFHDSSLVSVRLEEADLRRAEFFQAKLQSAHLDGADLTGAEFHDADINDAFFRGVVLDHSAAKSLSRAHNWDKAHFDQASADLVRAAASA